MVRKSRRCGFSELCGSLTFLQQLLEKGLAFSTVKVDLDAISACHIGNVKERDGPVGLEVSVGCAVTSAV